MNIKTLVLGNLVIDFNITESGSWTGPGGSSYYISLTYANLGAETLIVSPRGRDFPAGNLRNTSFFPDNPVSDRTFVFKNEMKIGGSRIQKVENVPSADYSGIGYFEEKLYDGRDIVMSAPILPNVDSSIIAAKKKSHPKTLFVLCPQGMFREVDDGNIRLVYWRDGMEISSGYDLMIVSEKDFTGMDDWAKAISRGKTISVVTKADEGCSVYIKGDRKDIRAFKADTIIDSTGSGDIFAAAYSWYFITCQDPFKSAVFANAVASYSLRFSRDSIRYEYGDIISFIESFGREKEI